MTVTAYMQVHSIGLEGLRRLARDVRILQWVEPPQQGFVESLFLDPPERTYTGCLPVDYRQMAGDTDTVIIEWELIGPRANPNVLSSVADQMLTSLQINRVLKQERVDRSNRVLQILTNDRIVHYPAEETVPAMIPSSPIEFRSHRASRPASLVCQGGGWSLTLPTLEGSKS